MENKLQCQVVMLPTEDKTTLKLFVDEIKIEDYFGPSVYKSQHLYLVSDREIKESDWIICIGADYDGTSIQEICSRLGQVMKYTGKELGTIKIEATTDSSLGLPLIPQKWIEEVYIPAQGKIDTVYLKISYDPAYTAKPGEKFVLTNPAHEVIILPVKDSWNREEVREMHARWEIFLISGERRHETFFDWFDKNY